MLARWISAALIAVLVVGCDAAAPASAPSSSPSGSAAAVAPSTTPTATPAAAATPRPSGPSATLAPVAGPIAGIWRVRKVLSQDDRSALLPGAVFDEEAFEVTPECDLEPCPSVEVRTTPLGRRQPVSIAILKREGDRYVSAARAENEGPCIDPDGDRVQGGATVTSTLRLWLAIVRAEGSAVEQTQLTGSLELDLTPTEVGSAAGCEAQSAAYELTGRREEIAVRDAPLPNVDEPPNTAGGMADLPSLSVKVTGAEVSYFEIDGDTVNELASSLADGGVQACGAINYEWNRGDDRPAACAVTSFPNVLDAIDQRLESNGDCTIAKATVRARFTIHFPRWVAPKRVPARLLAWWRDVVEFIRDHEAGHVVISRDHVKRLNANLIGEDCEDAESIIGRWAKGLSAAHEEYDRGEYAKPWPEPPAGY